jgi:hypothetical protein
MIVKIFMIKNNVWLTSADFEKCDGIDEDIASYYYDGLLIRCDADKSFTAEVCDASMSS